MLSQSKTIFKIIMLVLISVPGVWLNAENAHAAVECPNGELAETIEECPADSIKDSSLNCLDQVGTEQEGAEQTNCAGANYGELDEASDDPTTDDAKVEDAAADIEEEDAETPLWPMYLSVGAIVISIVLIFFINISKRKTRK